VEAFVITVFQLCFGLSFLSVEQTRRVWNFTVHISFWSMLKMLLYW